MAGDEQVVVGSVRAGQRVMITKRSVTFVTDFVSHNVKGTVVNEGYRQGEHVACRPRRLAFILQSATGVGRRSTGSHNQRKAQRYILHAGDGTGERPGRNPRAW